MDKISCWDGLGFCNDQPDGGTGERQLGPSAVAMTPAHELYQELRKLKKELMVNFAADEDPLPGESSRLTTEEDGVQFGKSDFATVPPSSRTSLRTQNMIISAAVMQAESEASGVARSLTATGRSKIGSQSISSSGTGTCKVLETLNVYRRETQGLAAICTTTPLLTAKAETSASKPYSGMHATPCSARIKLISTTPAVGTRGATTKSLGGAGRIARNMPAVKSCFGTGGTCGRMKPSALPTCKAATPDASVQKEQQQQQRPSVSVPASVECQVASMEARSLLDTAASSYIAATPPNIILDSTWHSVSAAPHPAGSAPSPAPAQQWEALPLPPAQQEYLGLAALSVQRCIPDAPSSSPPASSVTADSWMHMDVDSELETLMMTSDAGPDSDEWNDGSLPGSKVWDFMHSDATIGWCCSSSSSRDMFVPFSSTEVASAVAPKATSPTSELSSTIFDAVQGASTDPKPSERAPIIPNAASRTSQCKVGSNVSRGTPVLATASLPGAKTPMTFRMTSAISGHMPHLSKLSAPRVVRPKVAELKGPSSTVRASHTSGRTSPAAEATATKSYLGSIGKGQCKSSSARSVVTAAAPAKSVQGQQPPASKSPVTPNSNTMARKASGMLGPGKPLPTVAQQLKSLTVTPATPCFPAAKTARRPKPAVAPSCTAAQSSAAAASMGPATLLGPAPDFLADMSLDDMLASDPALEASVRADVAAGVFKADLLAASRMQRGVADASLFIPLGIATADMGASDEWMKLDIDMELESLMPGGQGLDGGMEGQVGSESGELWSLIAMEAELLFVKFTNHTEGRVL